MNNLTIYLPLIWALSFAIACSGKSCITDANQADMNYRAQGNSGVEQSHVTSKLEGQASKHAIDINLQHPSGRLLALYVVEVGKIADYVKIELWYEDFGYTLKQVKVMRLGDVLRTPISDKPELGEYSGAKFKIHAIIRDTDTLPLGVMLKCMTTGDTYQLMLAESAGQGYIKLAENLNKMLPNKE